MCGTLKFTIHDSSTNFPNYVSRAHIIFGQVLLSFLTISFAIDIVYVALSVHYKDPYRRYSVVEWGNVKFF